jgi:SOS response regulatory protein OraA/RecX
MSEFLARFSAGELIGLVAVVMGPLVAIVAVLATQWRKVRIAEMEATLKQQMLDKGMTPDQIEQVMNASNEPSGKPVPLTGNEKLDKAALAQKMVEEGYEGEDIERVLQAYESPKEPQQNHR